MKPSSLIILKTNAARIFQISVSINGRNVTLNPSSSCLESTVDPKALAVRLCSEVNHCESNPCIRKCCGENEFGIKCLGHRTSLLTEFRNSLAELLQEGSSDLPQSLCFMCCFRCLLASQPLSLLLSFV